MRSNLFAPENQEQEHTQPGLRLQNGKMLKIELDGEAYARQGAMVAYQGDVRFEAKGAGGLGKFFKQKLTGEGVPLMTLSGRGDVFLADAASDVHLIDLEGPDDALSINGKNVLAFEPSLSYDIAMVSGAGSMGGAGLFNCVFSGRGRLAITAKGAPVVLNVDQPTFADPHAAIAWSAGLRVGIQRTESFGLGTLIGRTTGEAYSMAFSGRGFVIVQPSEEVPTAGLAGDGSGGQAGQGGFGGIFN